MIDALGNPQSLLLVGGTSDIGLAIARRLATGGRLERVVLAGRPSSRRDEARSAVAGFGVTTVDAVDFDVTDTAAHDEFFDREFTSGDLDVVVLAAGVLADNTAALADPAVAVDAAMVNYVGTMSAALHAAQRLKAQGHGVLVVLSSVAGERPRLSNFVYGSTKAAIDALAVGLAESLRGTGVSVLVVRPGFVRTRMTAGMTPAPFATDADAVADAVAAHLTSGSRVLWVPGILRVVMTVLRHLPAAIFRRLPQ